MERKVVRPVLAAVTFVAAALLCAPALADDYGPHPDLRAIYHDLPIIMNFGGRGAIDGVVVKNNDALAAWHFGGLTIVTQLVRRYDRWWVTTKYGPDRCEDRYALQSPIRALGILHLAALQAPPPSVTLNNRLCDKFPVSGLLTSPQAFEADDYRMTWSPADNDAPKEARVPWQLRIPTEAESWMTRGGNSYFFFSANVRSEAPIHFKADTTIDVHFPFAVPPEKKYSLTIGYTDEPIGPIDGTLKDNTLHFVLPAFSIKPGAHLMGEIEGDPPGL